jgi:mRNA interferase MazF
MTISDRHDVVVVLFPFSEQAGAKPRPALTLSRRQFNARHGATVLAMITTAAYTRWPSDVTISNGASAGLAAPSAVRLKLFTLDNGLIARRIGRLSRSDSASVRSALGRALG